MKMKKVGSSKAQMLKLALTYLPEGKPLGDSYVFGRGMTRYIATEKDLVKLGGMIYDSYNDLDPSDYQAWLGGLESHTW